MPGLFCLLTCLYDAIPDQTDISAHLRKHLMRLPVHDIDDATVKTWNAAMDAIAERDHDRIHRRAKAYVDRVRTANGTTHLSRNEKNRLIPVKNGVLRVHGSICKTSGACAIAQAARRKKCLFNCKNQAIFTLVGRPLGECR